MYGCSDSFIADNEFTITWNDGNHGVYEPSEFIPTDLGVKYRAKVSASKGSQRISFVSYHALSV